MGTSCCVQKFGSGYKGKDMAGIRMFTVRKEWKGKIPRDSNSVLAYSEDVIAMTNTDSSKTNNLFINYLEKIILFAFNVVIILVDGHLSKVKFYKKELCGGKMKPYIENLLKDKKKRLIIFDSTHKEMC